MSKVSSIVKVIKDMKMGCWRRSLKKNLKERVLKFYAKDFNPVASKSITDSIIKNYNKGIHSKNMVYLA